MGSLHPFSINTDARDVQDFGPDLRESIAEENKLVRCEIPDHDHKTVFNIPNGHSGVDDIPARHCRLSIKASCVGRESSEESLSFGMTHEDELDVGSLDSGEIHYWKVIQDMTLGNDVHFFQGHVLITLLPPVAIIWVPHGCTREFHQRSYTISTLALAVSKHKHVRRVGKFTSQGGSVYPCLS